MDEECFDSWRDQFVFVFCFNEDEQTFSLCRYKKSGLVDVFSSPVYAIKNKVLQKYAPVADVLFREVGLFVY